MPQRYVRRKKLIKPRLQLRLTGIFVGLTALSLLLQFVLFTNVLNETAVGLPNDGRSSSRRPIGSRRRCSLCRSSSSCP